jgi:hypothetical protein
MFFELVVAYLFLEILNLVGFLVKFLFLFNILGMDLSTAIKIFKLESDVDLNLDYLKETYRELAKEAHPDKGGNHADFILLQEAYRLLLDKYDGVNDPSRKKLKILSKEEILDKYYEERKLFESEIEVLESELNKKNTIVDQTFFMAKDLSEQYHENTQKIQIDFENKINHLHSQYFPSLWKKIILFWNQKDKNQFNQKFQEITQKYQKLLDTKYQEYLIELNTLYGRSFDELNQNSETN